MEKQMTTKHINVTPTWKNLVPTLVELAEHGTTYESRQFAMKQLMSMADAADNWNKFVDENKTGDAHGTHA
jgi:hypothetical protein